jgi:nucleotide-binding universal stress UspA family protein
MFKHVLVATDGSAHADRAIALALRMAGRDGRVLALMVVPDYGMAEYTQAFLTLGPRPEELRAAIAGEGRRRLDAVLAAHGEHARQVRPLVAVSDQPWAEIVATAAREHCDVIVMAPRGRGAVASALLGSQTQRVIATSPVPVLVAP